MKTLQIEELNRIYDEAETVDRDVFAEMRSNVLLMAGEHYKKDTGSHPREGGTKSAQDVKLRLVKNHTHKIVRHYVTSVLSYAPGVAILPQMDTDLQDQKDAELNQAVWNQAKIDYRLKEKTRQWATDFCGPGEVAVKIFWDPEGGDLAGYNQLVDEETGEPVFEVDPSGALDQMGQPLQVPAPDKDSPVFKGAFVFESIFAANLLREASKKSMRDKGAWIVRKMVPTKDLKERYKDDPEKLRAIVSSEKDEFIVFDSNRAAYGKEKGQTLLREYYWAKCHEYPEGYFCFSTSAGIIEEGPLPKGVFPIAWTGFDEFPQSPRGRSIIKVARPYIAEINRASSAMAMHQVTIGDDKIIYQAGTKLSQGTLLPGVRGLTYQGREPTVLPGRDGGQYLNYIQAQVAELYSVVMLDEMSVEKNQTQDPLALLFRAASQNLKFSTYTEKFEQFLVDVCLIYLELAKFYLPDDAVIPAIGSRDQVNLEEFRKTTQLRYQIKVEPRADTMDQVMGKQIWAQNILQYAGKQLTRDDIGALMKEMPYGNFKETFDDFTIDRENAKNEMLALERGQWPYMGVHDNPEYMVKKLSARTRRPDFQFLSPEVQQLYTKRIEAYEQFAAEAQQKILAAQAEYIPTDGALVTCDIYLEDKENPENQAKRARVPQRALEWLIKQLEAQGASLESLEGLSQGGMAEIAQMLMNGQSPGGQGQPPTAESGQAPSQMGQYQSPLGA